MIRKPDRVKNTDTPRKPPLVPAHPAVEQQHGTDGERVEAVETCLVTEPSCACSVPRHQRWKLAVRERNHRTRAIRPSPPATDSGRAVVSAAVIRVGVTGHRNVDDEADVVRRLTAAVRAVRGDAPTSDVEIWSSLAEGADRLVAELVPAEAGGLVAVLPLADDDYRDDFASAESGEQFDRLLALAHRVDIVGPDEGGTRDSAYERAGLDGRRVSRRAARAVGRRAVPWSRRHGPDGRRSAPARTRGRGHPGEPVERLMWR